jgi:hypothetical protein
LRPSFDRAFRLLLAALTIQLGASQATDRPYMDAEAYRVYEAVMLHNRAYVDAESVLIKARSVSYSASCLKLPSEGASLIRQAVGNYSKVNRQSLELTRLFRLDKPYELLPESEFAGSLPQLKNSSRWRQYILGHPHFPGFIEFSGVGFSKDKTIAVVYMTRDCGALCASGDLIVLSRQASGWVPLDAPGFRCYWKS